MPPLLIFIYGFPANANDERTSHVVVITSIGSHVEPPVGCINNENSSQIQIATRNIWVEIQTEPIILLQSVRILEKNISLSEVNLVLYDSKEICESELISQKFPFEEDKDHANDIVPYFVHHVQEDYHETDTSKLRENFTRLTLLIIRIFLLLLWIPRVVLQKLHSVLLKRFDYSSSALQQILLRITQTEKLKEELQVKKRSLLSGRLLTMIVVDVLTGVAVFCIISSYASVNDIYTSFHSWTKVSFF